jgi:hypothetical protein
VAYRAKLKMQKYTNVVRLKVQSGHEKDLETLFKGDEKWDGQSPHILLRKGGQTYVGFGLQEFQERMQNAMSSMIALLNSAGHLLEKLSTKMGMTDLISGSGIFEG